MVHNADDSVETRIERLTRCLPCNPPVSHIADYGLTPPPGIPSFERPFMIVGIDEQGRLHSNHQDTFLGIVPQGKRNDFSFTVMPPSSAQIGSELLETNFSVSAHVAPAEIPLGLAFNGAKATRVSVGIPEAKYYDLRGYSSRVLERIVCDNLPTLMEEVSFLRRAKRQKKEISFGIIVCVCVADVTAQYVGNWEAGGKIPIPTPDALAAVGLQVSGNVLYKMVGSGIIGLRMEGFKLMRSSKRSAEWQVHQFYVQDRRGLETLMSTRRERNPRKVFTA